ncbi:MAG: RNA polymerase subunit sigma, partial [Rikenellaceae bacterium]|nr:RNA polymerase subunit sigma [Rikenellaceae bacterium]
MAQKEKVETKKDEVRYFTSEPREMLNKYLASDVVQKWSEDFIDEDTKEVVSVERTQKLFDRGRLIDQDLLTQINFHLQTGDIKEVEVSNQKRLAFENKNTFLHPWQAQAEIGDKKYKFLLYASGISNVIEILNDYIELNYASGFTLVMAKEIDSCIILTDNFEKQKVDLEKAYLKDEISLEEYVEAKDGAKDEDEEIKEKKFYQLEVKITYSDNIET